MLTIEQVASSQKSTLEALIALSEKAFEGVESLVELNMQAAKASLQEAQQASLAAVSAKDPQAFLDLQAQVMQPGTEKVAAYMRQVSEIAASLRPEFTNLFAQAATSAQGSFTELFDAAAKNAPAGSENGLALWKSAVATANNAFENLQKAAKQASDIAEANVVAATEQVVSATSQAPRKTKRA